MDDRILDHEAWPARAALLAGLGALLGLAFDLTISAGSNRWTEDPIRLSVASFVVVGGIAFAFTVERVRPLWSLFFANACGAISGLVFFWNGSPGGWSDSDGWRIFAALLAIAIAAPLFQSIRDEGRRRLRPPIVHAHAWTNLVLGFACCAFVLIAYLLAQLLAELFQLVGIDLLREALRQGWFTAALIGSAFGAAAGLLRDRDKVLALLQRVVTTVLSVLAPVFATGLVIFVIALPITGLAPLWEKTSATTPILLAAVAGAFFLANAVVGNSPEEEVSTPALRWSARALAVVMAPLAAVAAISTWLRIDQHGFTPERLWALVFVFVVLAIALTYLWHVIRGGGEWSARIRPANVRLAISVCAIALLLATPVVNFGAISTRDQILRLESGSVSPEEFDWAALRFDFGTPGRAALSQLAASGPAAIRDHARNALALSNRASASEAMRVAYVSRRLGSALRVLPRQSPVPLPLVEALARQGICGPGRCTLFWAPGARAAVAVGFQCAACQATASRLVLDERGEWQVVTIAGDLHRENPASVEEQRNALERGEVELRSVQRQQVFVGGKPVGMPFE